jgi:hypothetical protein
MFFWSYRRTTSGNLGISERNRSKPREDTCNINNGETSQTARSTTAHRTCSSISQFVAWLGETALPFYALIKKSDKKFEWTEEADAAFSQLKKVLSTPPVLVAPKEREPLLLYIVATHQVVSTVLVVEQSEEGKAHGVQQPVYFLSKVLSPSKQRYPHYQKLAYIVFTTSRKLRQYFAVHPIIVVNEVPLSNILNKPEAT